MRLEGEKQGDGVSLRGTVGHLDGREDVLGLGVDGSEDQSARKNARREGRKVSSTTFLSLRELTFLPSPPCRLTHPAPVPHSIIRLPNLS